MESKLVPKGEAKKLSIQDLPVETQKDVFKHASMDDLLVLALVSRHFHDLASAQLYRVLRFSLIDIGDMDYTSQTSRLASGLETLATSGRNYAKYIKELQLGLQGPEERAWRNPGDSILCGRLLNTLLLLALNKAGALETFQWNFRIQLNQSVFKALHGIQSLQHIRIRLKAGLPTPVEPPPLPISGMSNPTTASNPPSMSSVLTVKAMKLPQSPRLANHSPTFSGFKLLSSLAVLDMDTLDHVPELAKCILSSVCTLRSLELSISEAMALKARKPGVPQESDDETDPDLDENDNPWDAPPPLPPPPAGLMLGPLPQSSEADIRKERLAQDNFLARIFGLETLSSEVQKMDKETEAVATKPKEDAQKAFLKDLKTVMSKLIIATSSQNGSNFKPQKALDMVEKAAEKYLNATEKAGGSSSKKTWNSIPHAAKKEPITITGPFSTKSLGVDPFGALPSSSKAIDVYNLNPPQYTNSLLKDGLSLENEHKASTNNPSPSLGISSGSSTDPKLPNDSGSQPGKITLPWPSTNNGNDPKTANHVKYKGKAKLVDAAEPVLSSNGADEDDDNADGPGLFDSLIDTVKGSTRLDKEVDVTDDFDIVHPDVTTLDEGDDQEPNDPLVDPTDTKAADRSTTEELAMDTTSPTLTNGTVVSEHVSQKMVNGKSDDTAHMSTDQAMQNYVRSAHGLPLENLSLYLIPIKASVLSKAVDLTKLKSITLLNVGPQGGFWSVMAKKHLDTPLRLQYIHTDNVTSSFLSCVNSLSGLTDLFMLERSSKAKVESLAPSTMVGIDEIRRQALKKHMRSLKRLMIKNDNENDHSWDINGKTMRLITGKGNNLTELAVSLDSNNSHLFMQYLSGLKNLYALHVLNFRSDDTCIWVFRELRKFIVDNVSQHPGMKLAYLALKDSVSYLAHNPTLSNKMANSQSKKGKTTTHTGLEVAETDENDGDAEMVSEDGGISDDNDDDDDDFMANGLKIEIIDGMRFFDAPQVKIFSREVRLGKL